jgi:hypothetical protein
VANLDIGAILVRMQLPVQKLVGAISLALLAMVPFSYSQTSIPVQALVRAVSGTATASYEGQTAQRVRVGARYPGGTRIETGIGSYVDLFLGRGGGVLRIRENTSIVLERMFLTETGSELVSETGLNLINGEILGVVSRLSAGSVYEVKLPDGIVGIREGRYRLRVPGGLQMLTGEGVYVRDGKANIVLAGHEYNPSLPDPNRPIPPDQMPPANFFPTTTTDITPRPTQVPAPQQAPLSQVTGV